MESGRLEAFTDGVIAVIITIMVLELKAPHDASWEALTKIWPTFVSYVLSFIYVGIYWNNHHHLLRLPKQINGKIMWANLAFLFWLSLFPFTTSWLAEAEPPQPVPTAVYGFVLLMAALTWIPLLRFLISANGGPTGELAEAVRSTWKEYISVVIYAVAILAALFLSPIVACVLYAAVAAMWFIPDRRIEKKVAEET